jgi:tRNA threonylcarbamoyladenosine modification (KEOPS) complex Cgi121 subunit/molybdopterin converting factor small subunit
LITVKLLGGAKKSFNADTIYVPLESVTVRSIIDHLISIKPENTMEFDTKNILVAVNGVDSSALDGGNTVVQKGDTVSIIPIIHGGALGNLQSGKSIGVFLLSYEAGRNYELLDLIRKKFPDLLIEGISPNYVLSLSHATRIIKISLLAQQRRMLLSKKIQTDILLRFAGTTQINDAIKSVGIESDDSFVLVSAGSKSSEKKLAKFVSPYKTGKPDLSRNAARLKKQFKITNLHLKTAWSKNPLEDVLVEKAAVLFQ